MKKIIFLRFPNLKIRHRILAAAFVFGTIAVAYPLFINEYSRKIADNYDLKSDYWDLLYKTQVLNRSIAAIEAYLEPVNEQTLQRLDRITQEIGQHSKPYHKTEKLLSDYNGWRAKVFESPTQQRRDRVHAIEQASLQLETAILKMDHESRSQLKTYTRRARHYSFYTGLFFSAGLVLFLISLWNLLIPDLNALLKATKEFKHGNLDYNPEISGTSETANLAKSFVEMAASIKKQNEELKELNRLKTDFVSTVSHELRTPLTAIKGSIGLVLGGLTGALTKDQKEILGITDKNTDRLIRLINDVLDIAKIEAGAIRLNFSKYSIRDVITHAIKCVDVFARSHEVNLIYVPKVASPVVVVDSDKMEQVLANLLSNAIKFTPSGGSVTVDYEWDDTKVTLFVTDTGSGIPQEFMGRIFSKFQQADHSDRKALEGTGLGLAIVKGLVEEHGGCVAVSSQPGVGSQFSFTIPWNGHEFAANNGVIHNKAA